MQKNAHNGGTKLLARNTANQHLCSVEIWLDIIDQFHRLVGKSVTDRPLAVYKDTKNCRVLNIYSKDSKKVMQMVVKLKYGYTNQKALD